MHHPELSPADAEALSDSLALEADDLFRLGSDYHAAMLRSAALAVRLRSATARGAVRGMSEAQWYEAQTSSARRSGLVCVRPSRGVCKVWETSGADAGRPGVIPVAQLGRYQCQGLAQSAETTNVLADPDWLSAVARHPVAVAPLVTGLPLLPRGTLACSVVPPRT